MKLKEPYLEISFRRGRAVAAYFYLPRRPNDKSFRTALAEPGLIIDFNRRGQPIGIEITAPSRLSLTALNRVLNQLGLPAAKRSDLAPLRAA